MEGYEGLQEYSKLPFLLIKGSTVEYCNQRFCDLVLIPYDDICGKTLDQVLTMVKSKSNFESNRPHYIITAKLEPVEVVIDTIHLNECLKVLVFKPITNRKVEDRIPLLHNLMKDDKLGIAVFSVPDLILLQANDAYLKSIDSPYILKEEAIGKQVSEFFTGWNGSAAEKTVNELLDKKESYHYDEYKYKHCKRGVIYWESFLNPIIENDIIKYIVVMSRDITEKVMNRINMEEQVKIVSNENRKLEETLKVQEEFFSFIAHEFKTPLTVISSTVQLIKLIFKDQLSDKLMKYINKINQSTLQQLRLVSNLMDITKGEAGYLNVIRKNCNIVNITKAIVESVNEFAVRKNIRIYFITEFSQIITAIDDEKYERIMLNLLSNAIKFTPEGKNIYVSINSNNNAVTIKIKDEGVGIPEDKLKVIFDRFGQVNNSFTRKAEGTGIGLALVKILVQALNGEIKVKSRVGKGSVFTITLPICQVKEMDGGTSNELMDNRLVQSIKIEFSNIYLES